MTKQFLTTLLSLYFALSPCAAFQSTVAGKTVVVGQTAISGAAGGGGGGGSLTFVAADRCNSGGFTCNVASTFNVTAGDIILCNVKSTTLASNTLSCVDNDSGGSNTYTDCGSGVLNDGTELSQVFCAKAKATNATLTITPTVSNSANLMAGAAAQWHGTANNSIDQKAAAVNTASNSWSSGSTPTTTTANEALLGVINCSVSCSTFTATGGFTLRITASDSTCAFANSCFLDQNVTSTGAYAATATNLGTPTGEIFIITRK